MKTWMYLFLAGAFVACQDRNDVPGDPGQKNKTYTLSFQLGGELTEMSKEPTTRSEVKENRDLYWMEVWYSDKAKDQYAFYGRGVFDNPDSIKVEFKDGYKYKIGMAYVKNGKDKIWKDIVTGEYSYPITSNNSAYNSYKCDNRFITTTSQNNFGTANAGVFMQDKGNNNHFTYSELTGRYYGRIDDFIPEENVQVSVDMYKVSYGIQVRVNGLTDGKLNVYYYIRESELHFIFDKADGIRQQKEYNELQWEKDIDEIASIMNNKTGEQIVLSKTKFYVKWTNGNGLVNLDLGSKDFWLERNKMNIITVNLSQLPSVNNGATFTFETTPMTERESGSMEGNIE